VKIILPRCTHFQSLLILTHWVLLSWYVTNNYFELQKWCTVVSKMCMYIRTTVNYKKDVLTYPVVSCDNAQWTTCQGNLHRDNNWYPPDINLCALQVQILVNHACFFSYAAILQTPVGHKKRPSKHGYERTKINRKMIFIVLFCSVLYIESFRALPQS